jgi:hypothetical protein
MRNMKSPPTTEGLHTVLATSFYRLTAVSGSNVGQCNDDSALGAYDGLDIRVPRAGAVYTGPSFFRCAAREQRSSISFVDQRAGVDAKGDVQAFITFRAPTAWICSAFATRTPHYISSGRLHHSTGSEHGDHDSWQTEDSPIYTR